MKKKTLKRSRLFLAMLVFFLLLGYFLFILIRSITHSLIFLKKDRLNVVFYGRNTVFISLGLTDGVHYLIPYRNDLLVTVPGGYNQYKVGSLGKLAKLEKKPDLIQKTFSYSTSSMVDFYFYPKKTEVYSDTIVSDDAESIPRLTTLLSFNSPSNASLFERLFLFFLIVGKRKNDFAELNTRELGQGKYQGYFYQKSFRTEGKKVALLYTRYAAASYLTTLLEGEGIRVVDLSRVEEDGKSCIIKDIFDHNKPSLTSRYLAHVFSCSIGRKKENDVLKADIIVVLGERIEKEWE